MRIWLGGGPAAPLETVARGLEEYGHFVAADRPCDLRIWLDLGDRPRIPLPPGPGPLLVLTDRREVEELELLLAGSDAEWMSWPDEFRLLEARVRHAARRTEALPHIWASGVAHEISNPLTYVFANLELLERDLAHELPLRHLASEALHGCERIRGIVLGFRNLREPSESQSAEIDLRLVLKSSLRLLEQELRRRAIVYCDFVQVPLVRGDGGRFEQVFVNLLSNALHALPDRPPSENHVRVRLGQDDGHVVVEIADNGIGIDSAQRVRIFEPFFTTCDGGTGMGLPIARGIIEAAGGFMQVESEKGAGSLFRVVLPARW